MDNLFWLGRYAERTESFVRILRAVASRVGDEPDSALEVARKLLIPSARPAMRRSTRSPRKPTWCRNCSELIYSTRTSRGLQRLLSRVEQTAWTVRDRLSLDTWRTIHALTVNDELPPLDEPFEAPAARFYLDSLVRRAAALSGLSAENMTRGPNWLFMDLGRRLERAHHLAWLVRQTVGQADARETEHIRIVLEIADSAMTYRSRYLNAFQLVPFVDLLLLDEHNPRSCAFQLGAIENHLRELPRITLAQRSDVPRTIAQEMRSDIMNAHPARLAFCESGNRPGLIELTGLDFLRRRTSVRRRRRCLFPAFQPPPHRRSGASADGVQSPPSHHLSLSAGCFAFLASGASAAARNPGADRARQPDHSVAGSCQPGGAQRLLR